jgi:hypothetical protein
MPPKINYSDLKKRRSFNDLATFIVTDRTKIKYPDRTATLKLNEKLNKRSNKSKNKATKNKNNS